MVSEEESPLKFPTDYPVKILGRPSPEFRARIHAIVLKHVPDTPSDRVSSTACGALRTASIRRPPSS